MHLQFNTLIFSIDFFYSAIDLIYVLLFRMSLDKGIFTTPIILNILPPSY